MDYQLGPGPLQVDQNTIDEKIKGDIGIVENGDVATHAIPSGYYVIWKGDLYVAKTNISSGTTLSAESNGNLTAKPNGLGGEVAALNSKITNVETVHNPAGYDTSILEDVYAVRRGNAVLVTLTIKAGLSADWHNDIVTGLPPRFRPPVQVFGSHRIASGADTSKNIINVLASDGLTQFHCSAVFNAHIDCSFSFVALND